MLCHMLSLTVPLRTQACTICPSHTKLAASCVMILQDQRQKQHCCSAQQHLQPQGAARHAAAVAHKGRPPPAPHTICLVLTHHRCGCCRYDTRICQHHVFLMCEKHGRVVEQPLLKVSEGQAEAGCILTRGERHGHVRLGRESVRGERVRGELCCGGKVGSYKQLCCGHVLDWA